MKKQNIIAIMLTAIVVLLYSNISFAQNSNSKEISIKTSSQCEMCKKTIEKAVNKLSGIEKAVLNIDNKILTVNYDASKTNPDEIRKAVSKAGYDADDIKADPKAYNKLPKCCKVSGHK